MKRLAFFLFLVLFVSACGGTPDVPSEPLPEPPAEESTKIPVPSADEIRAEEVAKVLLVSLDGLEEPYTAEVDSAAAAVIKAAQEVSTMFGLSTADVSSYQSLYDEYFSGHEEISPQLSGSDDLSAEEALTITLAVHKDLQGLLAEEPQQLGLLDQAIQNIRDAYLEAQDDGGKMMKVCGGRGAVVEVHEECP